MVKTKIEEGFFSGELYSWKVESQKDQWEVLDEIADILDKNFEIEGIECSGDYFPDFTGDEYTSCKSVADMKQKMDRIKETADSVMFSVIYGAGEDDGTNIRVFLHQKDGVIVTSSNDDAPEFNKKFDKLLKEAFDK